LRGTKLGVTDLSAVVGAVLPVWVVLITGFVATLFVVEPGAEFAGLVLPDAATFTGGAIAGLTDGAIFAGILGVIAAPLLLFAADGFIGKLVILTIGWSIGDVLTGIGIALSGTTTVVACLFVADELAGLVFVGVLVCPGLTTNIIFLVVSWACSASWQIITKNNASVIFSVIGLFILVINKCLSIMRILR